MRKRLTAGTAVAAVLLTPAAALAQEVVVEPLEAAVGDEVVLRGEGCLAEDPVDFFLEPEVGDPVDFAEEPVVADAQGAFEAPDLVVPETDPGRFTVVAECGEERLEAPFTLLAAGTQTPAATPTASPTQTAPTPTPTDTTGATGSTDTGGTDTSTGTGTSAGTGGGTDTQVQTPTGGVAAGGGGGTDAPALALAAGGAMLVAGTALAGRAARARA